MKQNLRRRVTTTTSVTPEHLLLFELRHTLTSVEFGAKNAARCSVVDMKKINLQHLQSSLRLVKAPECNQTWD